MRQYLVVESLDLRSARPPFTFTAPGGAKESYVANAGARIDRPRSVEGLRHPTHRSVEALTRFATSEDGVG